MGKLYELYILKYMVYDDLPEFIHDVLSFLIHNIYLSFDYSEAFHAKKPEARHVVFQPCSRDKSPIPAPDFVVSAIKKRKKQRITQFMLKS